MTKVTEIAIGLHNIGECGIEVQSQRPLTQRVEGAPFGTLSRLALSPDPLRAPGPADIWSKPRAARSLAPETRSRIDTRAGGGLPLAAPRETQSPETSCPETRLRRDLAPSLTESRSQLRTNPCNAPRLPDNGRREDGSHSRGNRRGIAHTAVGDDPGG